MNEPNMKDQRPEAAYLLAAVRAVLGRLQILLSCPPNVQIQNPVFKVAAKVSLHFVPLVEGRSASKLGTEDFLGLIIILVEIIVLIIVGVDCELHV